MQDSEREKPRIKPDPYAGTRLPRKVTPRMVPQRIPWSKTQRKTMEEFGLQMNEWGQFVHPETGRPICGAKTRSGEPCMKYPMQGSRRCRLHGGASTGPKTEEGKARSRAALNPMANLIHGIYAKTPINEGEKEFYEHVMIEWPRLYDLDEADLLILEKAVMAFIQQCRVDKYIFQNGVVLQRGNQVYDAGSKFLSYMKELGLTRRFRKTQEGQQSASQSIAKLLAKIAEDEE